MDWLQDHTLIIIVLYTAQISPSNSTHPGLSGTTEETSPLSKRPRPSTDKPINIRLTAFHRKYWGAPLKTTLTTLPSLDTGSGNGEDPSDDVLPGKPFLDDVLGASYLVRAEYIRVFDWVQKIYDESKKSHLAVVTEQPGIGTTISAVQFRD